MWLAVATPAADSSSGNFKRICDRFLLRTDVSLSASEVVLLCGDKDSPGWRDVPMNQAVFHLKSFLQARGYFEPQFKEEGGLVRVDPGEPKRVVELELQGDPPADMNVGKMRNIRGEILTPQLLDDTKKRLVLKLEEISYPCAQVEMSADTKTGILRARIQKGPPVMINSVEREGIDDVRPEALSRFDAFRVGDWYNKLNLAVTSQRILDINLVQSTFFSVNCENNSIKQYFVPGPPRLFSLGIGVDTEQWGILRASWRNSRLWEMASQIQVSAATSFTQQEFSTDLRWFTNRKAPRNFLRATLGLKRENYKPYDRIITKLRVGPGYTFDNDKMGFELFIGPAGTLSHTERGEGARDAKLMSLNLFATLKSHPFEFYRNSPTEGWEMNLEADFSQENVASPITAHRFRVGYEKHWNLGDFEPPLSVLSLRGAYLTTWTPLNLRDTRIPSEFRHFLGGSPDIRGFDIRELPGRPEGSLTASFLGVENRFPDLLPWNLQPFYFVDMAMTGDESFSLDGPLYWSPGFGLRWQSKIGVIRVNLARGFISNEALSPVRPHWQLYFSYGEEF